MADIFISYSRQDSQHALVLVEHLRSSGMSVWIDQQGIEGATSWSKEIAEALEASHTVLLLLSGTAIASKNVAKELSVATQLDKRIVPVQIERVELRGEFLYHLASLQRVKITDLDGIVRAIGKYESATFQTHTAPVRPVDERKSLMILPFEDLSPTADNQWFADGIVNELISALSHIKSLRIADKQATKDYKRYPGTLPHYARESSIRYFIQGDVRKFGDKIKISASLLDIETGDHLWQDSMKGTMDDIFDIQEKVAENVVEGLKLHLTPKEQQSITNRGTESAEAYELYLRAFEYFMHHTKEHFEYAMKLIGHSLEIDPHFALAKLRRAIILVTYCLSYESHPEMVRETERLLQEASEVITPQEDWRILAIEAFLADLQGDKERTEALHMENFRIAPNEIERIGNLTQWYLKLGRPKEVFPLIDEYLTLAPATFDIGRIIMNTGWALNDKELLAKYIQEYDLLSIYRKRIHIMPDDDDSLAIYGLMLVYLGRTDEAKRHLDSIADSQIKSIIGCHNSACLAAHLGEPERAMRWLHQLAGFNENVEFPNRITDPELEALHPREDFQLLLEERQRRLNLND